MSEEEKKVFKELEDFIDDNEIQNISVFTDEKIKNIIEKQQKEIEEYKKIVECIEEFKRLKRPVMELVHEMNKFEDEFISKDKIKEKKTHY